MSHTETQLRQTVRVLPQRPSRSSEPGWRHARHVFEMKGTPASRLVKIRKLLCLPLEAFLLVSIFPVEAATYPGNGNSSFGGPIGLGSITLTDNGTTVSGTVNPGPNGFNDVLVIYIDSIGSTFTDTSGFNDAADGLRRAVSGIDGNGHRSLLTFPPRFHPSHAIALGPASDNFGGLWELHNGGNNSLNFITSVNLNPTGNNSSPTYTFSFNVAQIGMMPNSAGTFCMFGTYIRNDGYRSDEAVVGNLVGQPGYNPFSGTERASYTFVGPLPNTSYEVFTVGNNNDTGAGSLRQTIQDAATTCYMPLVDFATNVTGTITLTSGKLEIAKRLTIIGPGSGVLAVDGNGTSPVFMIKGGGISISGLTITNGIAGVVITNSDNLNSSGVFLKNCVVSGHSGFGIQNGTNCVSALLGCTIVNGTGGIFNTNGTVTANNCVVAAHNGRGIANGGTMALNGCTISSNSFGQSGAGIYNSSSLGMTNCTVSGNSATSPNNRGGGIYNNGGSLILMSCSICSNAIPIGTGVGGGFYNNVGTVTVGNSLIAGNSAVLGPDVGGAAVSSSGYNLIGKTNSSSGWVATDLVGSSASPLNPLLGPLQNNGGTTLTHALLAGSPAIDKGKALGVTTDQRGLARPYDDPAIANAGGGDGSDIGAFEAQVLALDIGLRIYDGSNIIKLGAEPGAPTSPFRINKNGTNYGIRLVETNSPDASRVRIQTPSGVKAVQKLP